VTVAAGLAEELRPWQGAQGTAAQELLHQPAVIRHRSSVDGKYGPTGLYIPHKAIDVVGAQATLVAINYDGVEFTRVREV
jgi:hypothetical protein